MYRFNNSTIFKNRIAASKALSAILKEVPLWSDNFPDLKDVSLENENLELLSWHKVNEHGKANQIILEEMVFLKIIHLFIVLISNQNFSNLFWTRGILNYFVDRSILKEY